MNCRVYNTIINLGNKTLLIKTKNDIENSNTKNSNDIEIKNENENI